MRRILNLWGRIWQYLSRYRAKFFTALAGIVVMTAGTGLQPFILGLATNELAANVVAIVKQEPGAAINFPFIGQMALVYLGATLIQSLGNWLGQFLMADVIQKAMYDIRHDIAEKTNQIPVAYFDRYQLGDILSRITNDVDSVATALQQSINQALISVLTVTANFIAMIALSPSLTIIVFITMIVEITALRALFSYSQPMFRKLQDSLGDLFGFTEEQLSGNTEIRAYNRQDESLAAFEDRTDALNTWGSHAMFLSSITLPVSNVIFNSCYAIVVLFGGLNVLKGTFAVGDLQAFAIYITQTNGPLGALMQLAGNVQSAFSATERIFEYLDEDELEQRETDAALPEPLKGRVTFDHVRFGYDPDNILMEDISFTVEPGQTAAIVGPTGAGKTTLINLLMRFYDVLDGRILIDGVDTRDIPRHDLRTHMGMVLQDAWLYSDSVLENIRFGNLDASDYEVVDAAKVANVHEFINTLPGTYDMKVNEEGTNISQGQKQLMTIARAVISDPDILILDEATSSVDTRLEKLIQDAMDRVMKGRTSFVIAHRLSTIKNADIILVMNHGTIIEHGTHDELMAENGFYADLYNSQFTHSDPADIHMSY